MTDASHALRGNRSLACCLYITLAGVCEVRRSRTKVAISLRRDEPIAGGTHRASFAQSFQSGSRNEMFREIP
jgi:hypothetical protein